MKKTLYPEIVNQMIKRNEKLHNLVEVLGFKEVSQVSRRLSGEIEWTISEAKVLCRHYNIDFWKLFERKEVE